MWGDRWEMALCLKPIQAVGSQPHWLRRAFLSDRLLCPVCMEMEWKVDNATRKWKSKGLARFHARVMAGFRAWQLCHPECGREALWLSP